MDALKGNPDKTEFIVLNLTDQFQKLSSRLLFSILGKFLNPSDMIRHILVWLDADFFSLNMVIRLVNDLVSSEFGVFTVKSMSSYI